MTFHRFPSLAGMLWIGHALTDVKSKALSIARGVSLRFNLTSPLESAWSRVAIWSPDCRSIGSITEERLKRFRWWTTTNWSECTK